MSGRNYLSKNLVQIAKAASTAGTSTISSNIIDTLGFQGVVFRVAVATPAANNSVKVQEDDDSAGGTMADILGSSIASGTGTTAIGLVAEIKPRKRYVRLVCTRGTSSALSEIWADLYGGSIPQDSNSALVLASEVHINAAEGTA